MQVGEVVGVSNLRVGQTVGFSTREQQQHNRPATAWAKERL